MRIDMYEMNITHPDDPFYRYKRPQFEIQSFKRKTWILNINSIAEALKRDVKLLEKYLGICCATSCKMNKQNILEINSVVDIPTLDLHLRIFVERYVLCPSCDLPETIIDKKNDKIEFNCSACGNINLLPLKIKYDTLIYNNL